MTDLLAARGQMAMSLAFHIVFAAVGMAMPLLMILAERRHLRTGDPVDLELARRWSRGTAILFAVGAVSGTVLSFELGLLWPRFMAFAGPIVGMPFSLEGFAFFLEAIFLGIYLYGWTRVRPGMHLFAGAMVLISGIASAVFVVCANAWMNAPTGFTMVGGEVVSVDPLAAMFNKAAFAESLHMVLAAFAAVGFAVAGVHAAMLLRRPGAVFHRRALGLALPVGCVAACLQLVSGDIAAKQVAETQPIKLAAMEGHWDTEKAAPLRVFGWPDEVKEETRWSIDIPWGLSFLAFGDPQAEVRGLKEFKKEDRPPVAVVHVAFQVMVMCGMAMIGVAVLAGWLKLRKLELERRWFLWLVVLTAPLGFVAIEAGWVVTEVGRQPWVVQDVMRTAEAVTPMPHLAVPFATFTLLYVVLGVTVVVLLRKQVFAAPEETE